MVWFEVWHHLNLVAPKMGVRDKVGHAAWLNEVKYVYFLGQPISCLFVSEFTLAAGLIALKRVEATTEGWNELRIEPLNEREVVRLAIEDLSFDLHLVVFFDLILLAPFLVPSVQRTHKGHLKFEVLVATNDEGDNLPDDSRVAADYCEGLIERVDRKDVSLYLVVLNKADSVETVAA
jgi:hypothetical protein